jgi:threonine dehydratase
VVIVKQTKVVRKNDFKRDRWVAKGNRALRGNIRVNIEALNSTKFAMITVSFQDIQDAAQRLNGQVLNTPCVESKTLSEITGAKVYLKFENLQFTASFKERGACNRLSKLSAAERAQGVVAMSAGNHAQGVAYHAQQLGIRAVIVMPRLTSVVKVERTKGFGATVVLHGDTLDEARSHAFELSTNQGLTFVHPYDDASVIAGQGTIGIEMLQAVPQLDTLVIAVGGGGLLSGIAIAAKTIKPSIEIIGVQTERFPSMINAIKGSNLPMGSATIADGIAVGRAGTITQAIIGKHVDDLLMVEEGDIEHAILLLLEVEKTVVEGAGAVGLAALIREPERFKGKTVGLVLCGGNIDPLLLASIIERGMVRAGRLARLRISARDIPGTLATITSLIAQTGANVDEVHHQRAFTHLAAQNVEIEVVIQARGMEHVNEVIAKLAEAGFVAELDQD